MPAKLQRRLFVFVILLALIAGRSGGIALFTLAGMMIASLAGALTSLAISLSPNPFALSEIVTWLMGALVDRGWADVSTLPVAALRFCQRLRKERAGSFIRKRESRMMPMPSH